MLVITDRGYKKADGNEGYDINVVNFNIDRNEEEHDQLQTLFGNGAPTSSTIGTVGQFYVNTTSSTKDVYLCTAKIDDVYTWQFADEYLRQQMEQIADRGYLNAKVILATQINDTKLNGKFKIQAQSIDDYSLMPFNESAGWLADVIASSSNYVVQYCTCYACDTASNVGRHYLHICKAGTWTWREMATVAQITTLQTQISELNAIVTSLLEA